MLKTTSFILNKMNIFLLFPLQCAVLQVAVFNICQKFVFLFFTTDSVKPSNFRFAITRDEFDLNSYSITTCNAFSQELQLSIG